MKPLIYYRNRSSVKSKELNILLTESGELKNPVLEIKELKEVSGIVFAVEPEDDGVARDFVSLRSSSELTDLFENVGLFNVFIKDNNLTIATSITMVKRAKMLYDVLKLPNRSIILRKGYFEVLLELSEQDFHEKLTSILTSTTHRQGIDSVSLSEKKGKFDFESTEFPSGNSASFFFPYSYNAYAYYMRSEQGEGVAGAYYRAPYRSDSRGIPFNPKEYAEFRTRTINTLKLVRHNGGFDRPSDAYTGILHKLTNMTLIDLILIDYLNQGKELKSLEEYVESVRGNISNSTEPSDNMKATRVIKSNNSVTSSLEYTGVIISTDYSKKD